MAVVAPSALTLWFLVFLYMLMPAIIFASDLSLVVSELTSLQLSPRLIRENSPGLRPGTKVKCGRVEIYGLSRLKHLEKFSNSVKVKVSTVNLTGHPPNAEICFHRNASLEIGMCPQEQWERLTEGLWAKSMSPFDYKILDLRMARSHSESLQVSLTEEFFFYRIIFLFFGILMMTLASWLSNSIVFYYSGAMTIGVFLVILMVLFQGMKLLPTGRKSSLAIFVYSCLVGVGSFLLRYVPRLLRLMLVEIGLPEDMHDPLAIILLVNLVIFGAWLGFWVVRKLVLTEDGSIDFGIAYFVSWVVRIFASVMILQSSVDPLLAAEALVCGIVVSLVLKKSIHPNMIHRAKRRLSRHNRMDYMKSPESYASQMNTSSMSKPSARARSPDRGSASKSPDILSTSASFYSSFHDTPLRRKYSKAEWDEFKSESTRKALKELVSTPDFSKWAVNHADSITLVPKKEVAVKQWRWFWWL